MLSLKFREKSIKMYFHIQLTSSIYIYFYAYNKGQDSTTYVVTSYWIVCSSNLFTNSDGLDIFICTFKGLTIFLLV